jgi:PmbA protein
MAESQSQDTELLALAERAAGWARDGEQLEVYVARSADLDVSVHKGDVESLSSAVSEGVGIRVVHGGRQGFAYAGTLDDDALAEVLADARDNASFGTVDEWAAVAEPDGVAPARLDLHRAGVAAMPTADKVAMALELEQQTLAGDPRIRVESAEYGDADMEMAIATSTGIRASNRRTVCSVTVFAMVADGDDTKTGYGYSVGRDPRELDLSVASGDAVERALRLLGARQPASQRTTMVLEPRMTGALLGILGGTLNGEAVLKGRSLFQGRVGEAIASGVVTLVDDPTMPEAYGASPFDAEGLATRRTPLIESGVLQSFLHNSYTGRRSGSGSTGSAIRGGFKSTPGVGARALSLQPGTLDLDALLAEAGDAVLVQSMTGLHSGVNPISGDFSVGIEGMLVRGGQLTEPIREATVASTLQRMLLEIEAVGSDLEWLPGGAAGVTLVIRDVTLSGA